MISVIISMHTITVQFKKLQSQLRQEKKNIEIIYVFSVDAVKEIITRGLKEELSEQSNELVLINNKKGRGYAIFKGIERAQGEIILIVHADTILPKNWYDVIERTMEDKRVVLGGFSHKFDLPSRYLRLLVLFSDWLFYLTRELWGDRALFVRKNILDQCCLDAINVPIMEDVRLSHCMRAHGRIVLLKESVITSARAFIKNGKIGHTLRIGGTRLRYTLGMDLKKIYDYYYS